jgi:hypothetical protein
MNIVPRSDRAYTYLTGQMSAGVTQMKDIDTELLPVDDFTKARYQWTGSLCHADDVREIIYYHLEACGPDGDSYLDPMDIHAVY